VDKTLRMIFRNAENRTATISVSDPREDLGGAEVSAAMDLVIGTDIFDTTGGSITDKVRAEVVSRQVETIVEF